MNAKIKELVVKIKQGHYDQNPTEMIRMLENGLQKGRCLEVTDLQAENVGITNFIMVDRENLLNTGFDELR